MVETARPFVIYRSLNQENGMSYGTGFFGIVPTKLQACY